MCDIRMNVQCKVKSARIMVPWSRVKKYRHYYWDKLAKTLRTNFLNEVVIKKQFVRRKRVEPFVRRMAVAAKILITAESACVVQFHNSACWWGRGAGGPPTPPLIKLSDQRTAHIYLWHTLLIHARWLREHTAHCSGERCKCRDLWSEAPTNSLCRRWTYYHRYNL